MHPRDAVRGALVALMLLGCASCARPPADGAPPAQTSDLGRMTTEAAVAAWNIDVAPDGSGLPDGHGSAREGNDLYATRCAQCHDVPAFPQLAGGIGSLTKVPQKTPGSYWPYATTLYDYIYRTMPPAHPQSLTPSEVYALTAYVLAQSGIVTRDRVLDRTALPAVIMPNRDGFFSDDGKPDT